MKVLTFAIVLTASSALGAWDVEGFVNICDSSVYEGGEEDYWKNIVLTLDDGSDNLVVDKIGDDIYVHAIYTGAKGEEGYHEQGTQRYRLFHSYAKVTGQSSTGFENMEDVHTAIEIDIDEISDTDPRLAINPAVALDDYHNLHVVWEDSRHCLEEPAEEGGYWYNYEIYYVKGTYVAGTPPTWTWGNAVRITNAEGYSGNPNIALDSRGNAHIVWIDSRNDWARSHGLEDIYYTTYGPGGVGPLTRLTDYDRGFIGFFPEDRLNPGSPVIICDEYGCVHVFWGDNHEWVEEEGTFAPKWKVYYRRKPLYGIWGPVVDIANDVFSEDNIYQWPAVTAGNGFVWAALADRGPINEEDNASAPCDFQFMKIDAFGNFTSLPGCTYANGCGDFSLSADGDGNVLMAARKGSGGGQDPLTLYDLGFFAYDIINSEWYNISVIQDGQASENKFHFAKNCAPTIKVDADDHLHVVYQEWYRMGNTGAEQYDTVFYENNWNPGLRSSSPPAPPTDLVADSDTRRKTGSIDVTWTLSINDPEYWNRFAAEPTPLSAPDMKASGVSALPGLSTAGVATEGSAAPVSAAEGDKMKGAVGSAGPAAVGAPDASVSILRPDELDVEEYWVIVHYYPDGADGRTEEYLAGGPGTDKFTVPNVPAGVIADYSFSVYCKDAVYDSEITGPCAAALEAEAITGEGEASTSFTGGAIPTVYALYQSVPNPNDGTCSIAYDLPEACHAKMTVYDLTGRRVQTVFDSDMDAGAYACTVSGLSAGVYVYRLEAGDFVASRKMVVIR
jgi:hypothetical protein